MAITKYPLIDAFETTLSQERDGLTGTIYVNSVPEFTFPGGVTTYIVVDADNSKIQVAEISAISTGAKTMTVNSVSVAKGNGVAYTSQVHSIGAKVRISDNYIFWKTIVDAVNGIETGTVQTNVNGTTIGTYADATARDAAITSPINGKYQAYLTSEGYWTDYVGGSWQQRATGVTPNASTTVSGKVEIATDAQFTAGTTTGETGALLVATPDQLKKSISLRNSTSSFNDADEFGINQGGEDKRITKTTMRDQLAASTTAKGTVEMATDAEATTGTDETRYINPKQASDNYKRVISAGTSRTLASMPTARGTSSTTFVELKRFTVGSTLYKNGPYRITYNYDLGSSGSGAEADLRVNGVSVALQSIALNSSNVLVTVDRTLEANDIVTLHLRRLIASGSTPSIVNFQCRYDFKLVWEDTITATVNTD